MTKLLKTALVSALVVGCSMFTFAGNVQLVTNGGFETGDFTGWTVGGNCSVFCNVTTTMPHTGLYSAQLGPQNTDGTLSQTLNTVVGGTYQVSFFLALGQGIPNDFSATIGGDTFFSLLNFPIALPYFEVTDTYVATSTSTLLQFAFRDDPSYFFLDDVSVIGPSGQNVPEPGSMALLGTGLLALGFAGRKLL